VVAWAAQPVCCGMSLLAAAMMQSFCCLSTPLCRLWCVLCCLLCHAVLRRSGPQQVRWTMTNVTMVLPQDSEMSYVTYMFTLYNSPLQYLKAQTQFYSDVLHMSMLQVRSDTASPADEQITLPFCWQQQTRAVASWFV
jgi:hypothetical protein